ncbi:TetR/AcrR family transcriptional regulator [Glycomyces terrestris]|nr:TetR family transcriptional regulator [Glycomyces terrestris]
MPTGSTARPTAQRTRDALLRAAYEEFTLFGPAGARVDRIADRAGCNKQRLYAYFKSKENLFGEVMREAHRRLAEEVPLPSDREELDEYVGRVFDFHRRDQSIVRLLAWEGLTYGRAALPWAEERRAFYEVKLTALRKAIGGDDPAMLAALLIELIAIASWPFVVPQQRRLLYEEYRPEVTTVDALRDSLNTLGRASIAAVARTPAE